MTHAAPSREETTMAIKTDRPREQVKTAFALGGYAGHNYHGLGFLHASLEMHVEPDMISCTSGQIYWVWNYLFARKNTLQDQPHAQNKANLEQLAEADLVKGPKPGLASYPEILQDMHSMYLNYLKKFSDLSPITGATFENWVASAEAHFINFTLSNIPAHVLDPAVDESLCQQIAEDFNAVEDIGIVFNSYNPLEGVEYVHLNPRAEHILDRKPNKPSSFRNSDYHKTIYKPIVGESVKNALWIYEYGFHGQTFLDGAYFRQIMLGELARAKTIYVARPVRFNWLSELPISYGDKETLKTEIFFNSAYYGEKFRIELVNRMLRDRVINTDIIDEQKYHLVEIIEIPIRVQKAFASFLSEDMEVFRQAYEEGKANLK